MNNQTATDYLEEFILSIVSQEPFNWQLGQPVLLEHPADNKFGDYSTNVALMLAKSVTGFQNPREIATAIVERLNQKKNTEQNSPVARIEVAGPGFINFYLSDTFLLQKMSSFALGQLAVANSDWLHQKVMVEFTDPNPFKEFHIGHLYSNTVGESVCRILEKCGAEVKRADYFGDVGMHVAKSVWGMIKKLDIKPSTLNADLDELTLKNNYQQLKLILDNLVQKTVAERVKLLGQAYALGATAYEEDKTAQQEIKEINFLTYLAGQKRLVEEEGWLAQVDYQQFLQRSRYDYAQINLLYQAGRAWSLAYFETIYDRVGMRFDYYFPESEAGEYGVKVVKQFLAKGIFKESQGAIIFPGSEIGLHDRVFINSLGLPTYETKELGLPIRKYERFAYDKSIIITGNEINEYFKVLLAALAKINPKLAQATTHIGHGMVRLPEGKMSSRTGKIITGEWLIEEAKKRIIEILSDSRPEIEKTERLLIAEQVGLAAIKYAFLKANVGGDIAFSFNESLSFQGNSGPYLQYTYVRCLSVLQKAVDLSDRKNIVTKLIDIFINNKSYLKYQPDLLEKEILRYIYQYFEIVEIAAKECSPHHITTYIYNLAQKFNTFYNQNRILNEKSDREALSEPTQFRLILTAAVGQVIKDGLGLLGINTVDKM